MNNLTNIIVASKYEKDQKLIISALPETMGFNIVGVENDESETIIRSQRLQPDVLILDFNITIITSTELLSIIRRLSPSTSIIILCENNEDDRVMLAIRAGISGYLIKEDDFEKLAYVIKLAVLGGCYINASIIRRIVNKTKILNQLSEHLFADKLAEIAGNNENANDIYSFFSPLEKIVITKMAQGYSDNQIAKHTGYNVGTIRNSLLEVKRNINFNTRIEIVLFSLFYGIIRLENLTSWFKKAELIFKNLVSKGNNSEKKRRRKSEKT